MTSGTWAPAVDMAEENDKLLVRVEVPGVDEKDLKVHFEDGLLTVTGERHFERKETPNDHRIERAYGNFVRTFRLPRSIDATNIAAANDRDGVLEIEIPKARRIEAEADRDERRIAEADQRVTSGRSRVAGLCHAARDPISGPGVSSAED